MFNNGTLLKGVLIPKLLNIPIACCFLINLNFLLHNLHNLIVSLTYFV